MVFTSVALPEHERVKPQLQWLTRRGIERGPRFPPRYRPSQGGSCTAFEQAAIFGYSPSQKKQKSCIGRGIGWSC